MWQPAGNSVVQCGKVRACSADVQHMAQVHVDEVSATLFRCVLDQMFPAADPEATEDLKAVSGKAGQQADRGMVLPFEPLAMSFSHMWYSVPMPAGMEPGPDATKDGGKPRLHLLKDVSGAFRPGVLTALVGESGAGKTTLMVRTSARKCKMISSIAD